MEVVYRARQGRLNRVVALKMMTLRQVLEQEPQRPRRLNGRVDPALEAICLRCLEKAPQDRYASAEALAEDLEAYLRGDPVLAEAGSSHRLLRRLLRETRHTEVMARWGRVWICHAVQVFMLFLITNLLTARGETRHWPYTALWIPGLLSLTVPPWFYRFRSGIPLTPIERQVGQVWGMFFVACLLTGAINRLMGMEVLHLLPLVVLECAFAFGCMAAILGGSFNAMAVACALLALLLAVAPGIGPAVFGTVFAVGLLIPGWKYTRPTAGPGVPTGA